MTIFFDMDGTIANLYGVENWLDMLRAYDPTPYAEAEVMLNMSVLARYLHKAQKAGYKIGIISWLSKTPTPEYNKLVTLAKLNWLEEHLPSVKWDTVNICSYGTPKNTFMETDEDILFDDEEQNRDSWDGLALEPTEILSTLKELLNGR